MLSLLLDCHELPERIRKGHDTPFPVRRVEIPKPDGEMRKLGIPMGQPSSKKNKTTIRHQFDRFCQKILHDEKVDYIREQEYRKQHEITLNEIPKKELDKVHVLDEYDVEYDHFQVLGYDIAVKDTLIAEALKELSDRKRNVILLSYFMEMSDSDIAKEMQLVRETIYLHRKGSIKILKKIIEEIKKDEENEF